MSSVPALDGSNPSFSRAAYRRLRVGFSRWKNGRRALEDVFRDAYEKNLWVGKPREYCSGSGSLPEFAEPYAEAVRAFIAEKGIRSVVDVGCGDFAVGRRLVPPGIRYVGIDVVRGLVERNQREFGSETVAFLWRDATRDELPPADLCLVRQVLQHLSNAEILRVLERVRNYPFLIVTEHTPAAGAHVRPNLDKPHGPDTRILDDSGVFLDQEPFGCGIERVLLEQPVRRLLRRPGETIRTLLVRVPRPGGAA